MVPSVLEEQKAGVQKEASDLRASLREVEKARLDARRELQELRRQVKMLDGERNKLGQEVVDLQGRVARDEEKEEESRKENFGLKQRVSSITVFNVLLECRVAYQNIIQHRFYGLVGQTLSA